MLSDRQIAAALRSEEWPVVALEIEKFEEALNSELAPTSPVDLHQYELNRALGVA